jgi:hypothetical protein
MHTDKIKLQVDEFVADPELSLCHVMFSNFLTPDADPELKKIRPEKEGPMRMGICGVTMLRRKAFDRVGLFDTTLQVGEWIDWYAKAKDLGLKEKFIEKDLYNRRSHASNTTATQRQSFKDYAKLLRAKIDRKK